MLSRINTIDTIQPLVDGTHSTGSHTYIPAISTPLINPDIHYLYLLSEREFRGHNVYKLGRTVQKPHQRALQRFEGYAKDSEIALLQSVPDSVTAERELLKIFRTRFIARTDIGDEYFEGDPRLMTTLFFDFVQEVNLRALYNGDDAMNDRAYYGGMQFCHPPSYDIPQYLRSECWEYMVYIVWLIVVGLLAICVILLVACIFYIYFTIVNT